MWTRYDLTLNINRLVGGIPKHQEIVKRWQDARFPRDKTTAGKTIDEATEQTVTLLGDQAITDADVDGIWTGFVTNGDQLCIEARIVKAMLKESANILRQIVEVKVPGKRDLRTVPLRARLAERVFVAPNLIPLDRSQPDETVERPIHVMTAQGPRTALKRTDVCHDVKITCTLKVLDDGMFTEDVLRMILEHAAENGLGTDRSQGNGTFTYELIALDEAP